MRKWIIGISVLVMTEACSVSEALPIAHSPTSAAVSNGMETVTADTWKSMRTSVVEAVASPLFDWSTACLNFDLSSKTKLPTGEVKSVCQLHDFPEFALVFVSNKATLEKGQLAHARRHNESELGLLRRLAAKFEEGGPTVPPFDAHVLELPAINLRASAPETVTDHATRTAGYLMRYVNEREYVYWHGYRQISSLVTEKQLRPPEAPPGTLMSEVVAHKLCGDLKTTLEAYETRGLHIGDPQGFIERESGDLLFIDPGSLYQTPERQLVEIKTLREAIKALLCP